MRPITRRTRSSAAPAVNRGDGRAPAGWGRTALPWAALAAAALTVKTVALAQLCDHPLLQPTGGLDAAAYVGLARDLAARGFFAGSQAFFVSPFYILFLVAVSWLGKDATIVPRIAQVALGVLTVVLIAATARRWFGARAGWVAGALAIATGLFSFYESLILQAALDPLLTALALYLVTRTVQDDRWHDALGAGLALGALALNRPNTLPYAVVAAALVALTRVRASSAGDDARAKSALRSGWRTLGPAALISLGLIAAIGPIAVRNFVVSGDLVLISSHGGLNFFIGNNAEADGTYHAVPGITPSILGQAVDANRVAEAAAGRPLGPAGVSSRFSSLAWRWIGEHPADAARLFARKIALTFNAGHLTLTASYPFYAYDERTILRFLAVGPWIIVPLGLVGLLLPAARTSRAGYWAWASFVPVYGVFVAAFFVSSRYRLPLLVPLTCAAGGASVWLVGQARARRWRALAAPAVTLALAATLANRDFGFDDGRNAERTEMILSLVDSRQDQQAAELLARTEPVHRQRDLLLYRVGRAYTERGEPSRAIPLLERALEANRDQPQVRLALGQALLDAGRSPEAAPHLEAALRAGTQPAVAAFDLARALTASGDRAKALEALRAMPEADRLDTASVVAVGRLALELGDPQASETWLARAVVRAPGDAAAHEALGLALGMQQGRRAEAIAALETACRLSPTSASAHLNLAVLLAEAGRLAEARPYAAEALRLDPSYTRAKELISAIDRAR